MVRLTQFDARLHRIWETAAKAGSYRKPFSSFSWHQLWFEVFGQGETLTILADSDIPAVIPLSVCDGVARFTGGDEISDYLDALGTPEALHGLWKSAAPELVTAGAAAIRLRNVPDGSPTLGYFRSVPGADITREDVTPLLHLPGSYDEYLESLPRKLRHEFRRKRKKFDTSYPDVSFSVTDTADMDLLFALMRNNPEKAAFLTPDMQRFFRKIPAIATDNVRQSTVFVRGHPVATAISFLADGELQLYNSGYDPVVSGAGWYLKAALLRWAPEHGIRTVNFLQGNERYKYDFGAQDVPVWRITLRM